MLTAQAENDRVLYADEAGPLAEFTVGNIVRIDFSLVGRKRNAKQLVGAFWRLVEVWKKRGVREIICHSTCPGMVRLLEKRLHFRLIGSDEYRLRIQ